MDGDVRAAKTQRAAEEADFADAEATENLLTFRLFSNIWILCRDLYDLCTDEAIKDAGERKQGGIGGGGGGGQTGLAGAVGEGGA